MAAEHAELLVSLAVAQPGHTASQQLSNIVTISQHSPVQQHIQEVESSFEEHNLPAFVATHFNLRKKRKHYLLEEESDHIDHKVMPTKDRTSGKMDMRRPVRPIDRQKMRPWLKNLLDTGSVFGLNWMKREEGIFQISWRHASRLGWNLETDGDVFERWARHTGIFKDGDTPEPKRWKANFRCALHSLPDVKELTSPTDRKGRNASRTYRFLNPSEVQPPIKRKHRYNIPMPYQVDHPNSDDSAVSPNAESDERNSDDDSMAESVRQVPHCDHDYAVKQDKTAPEDGQTTTAILQRHGSGYVLIKSKGANEYEFRLTSSSAESSSGTELLLPESKKQTGMQKSLSPPKKTHPNKKTSVGKSPPKNSADTKKRTSKETALSTLKPKSAKRLVTRVKKSASGEKVAQSGEKPVKMTLKALLAGRQRKQSSSSTKRRRPTGSAGLTLKHKRLVKPNTLLENRNNSGSGSGKSTPTQHQGLQACMLLLEAATQLDRMDSLTCTNTTIVATANSNTATVLHNLSSVSSSAVVSVTAPLSSFPNLVPEYSSLPVLKPITHTPAMASLLSAASLATTSVVSTPSTFVPLTMIGNTVDPKVNLDCSSERTSSSANFAQKKGEIHLGDINTGLASVHMGSSNSMLKHLLRLTRSPQPTASPVQMASAKESVGQNNTNIIHPVVKGATLKDASKELHIVKEISPTTPQKIISRMGFNNLEIEPDLEIDSSIQAIKAETDKMTIPSVNISNACTKSELHNKEESGVAVVSIALDISPQPVAVKKELMSSLPNLTMSPTDSQLHLLSDTKDTVQTIAALESTVLNSNDDCIAKNITYNLKQTYHSELDGLHISDQSGTRTFTTCEQPVHEHWTSTTSCSSQRQIFTGVLADTRESNSNREQILNSYGQTQKRTNQDVTSLSDASSGKVNDQDDKLSVI